MSEPQSQQLTCQLQIPLAWLPEIAAPTPFEPLHQANLAKLNNIEALETSIRTPGPADTDSELRSDVQRIERKLDVLLHLFAGLMTQQNRCAETALVTLGIDQVIWHSPTLLPVGTGRLALYLHPCLTEPVYLPAQISQDRGLVTCQLDPLPDALADAWAAYIFRRHRKEIAQARHPASTSERRSN